MDAAKPGAQRPTLFALRSEVDGLLASIRHDYNHPQFRHDAHVQSLALRKLQRVWTQLSPLQQSGVVEDMAPHLPRCMESPHPAQCLTEILQLPKEEDVHRALLVRESKYDLWLPTETEGIYPTTGFIGAYLRYCRYSVVPLEFHFWCAITILGAVAKNRIYFEGGSYRLYLPWYIVLAGTKATCKSVALDVMLDMVGRLNQVIGPLGEQELKAKHVHVLPSDITPEDLTRQLSQLGSMELGGKRDPDDPERFIASDKRWIDAAGLLAVDELSTFYGSKTHNVDHKAALLASLGGGSGRDYAKSTIGRGPEQIRSPALSFIGCCAPDWLRTAITPTMLGGGLTDRHVYCFRNPVWKRLEQYTHKPDSPPLDPLAANLLAKQLSTIANMQYKLPAVLNESAERAYAKTSARALADRRQRYELTRGSDEGTSYLRYLNGVTKLAIMLALSEGEFGETTLEVNGDQVEMATQILDAEDGSLEQFVQVGKRTDSADHFNRIVRWVHNQGGCATKAKLTTRFYQVGTAKHLEEVYLQPLLQGQRLETTISVAKGKRALVYRIPGHGCHKCGPAVEVLEHE